ncbi:HIT-like domain-containing protein [Halteromyces radiatus]|uniref:HIT-like domain-containing protein n=1 Tax=Halteromyces radiatus TaxID=101107 RepID=UPI00221EBAAD|nr:HIT-like domain-containing protein [Halteromyces radiatus]KAI8079976.1 HIT-like domain-containing protein [Halteromyces radiatus]
MFKFGPNLIPETQIFYKSTYCFGLVNLKPIVAGHVLVVSKRLVTRFNDLTAEEAVDMMLSTKKISAIIEKQYQGSSLTFAMQDGPEAGQTVPHVHMHIIPRRKGDYANNDDIYEDLDQRNKHKKGPDNEERTPRSAAEMKEEADFLRVFFNNDE